MESISLREIELWYLNDEREKYLHNELFQSCIKRNWSKTGFKDSQDSILDRIGELSTDEISVLTKFFMSDTRNSPEPLLYTLRKQGNWSRDQILCDKVWIDSFGGPNSRVLEIFKSKSELRAICTLSDWLTCEASQILPGFEWECIENYHPRPSDLDVPLKIAVERITSDSNPLLKYKILQGLHRIIQACAERREKIDAYIYTATK